MDFVEAVKSIGKRLVPDPILFRISPPLVGRYARLMTWYACGRHYDARIDPFELIYIDPCEIEEVITTKGREWFEYSDAVSEVVGGDWDKHVLELEEYDLYNAFVDRFQHGRSWCETEFYDRRKQLFEQGETRWGCENVKQFEARLEKLEDLFEHIDMYGYKTQDELQHLQNSDPALRRIHRYWPPRLHEVSVVISRNGEFILFDGRHRFTIARVLNIGRIPVRIKGRHTEWQLTRERYTEQECRSNDRIVNHPDLQL